MARQRREFTLPPDSIKYIDQFGNRQGSRVVEEALELHKNKDKIIMPNPKVRIEI